MYFYIEFLFTVLNFFLFIYIFKKLNIRISINEEKKR